MSKTFKIVLILLVVASIVSSVLAVFAFIGKEREYMKRLVIEDKLAATLKDKRNMEKELNLAQKAKEEIEKQIAQKDTKIQQLSTRIEEVKEQSKTFSLGLAEKKKEIEELMESLDKEQKEKMAISEKLDKIASDYEQAKKDVSKLTNEKARLEKELTDLNERFVKLDTIVVNPSLVESAVPEDGSSVPSAELIRGRVLVVNKDYSFIVTDLGEDEGVEKGMVFEIRSGSEYLGKAEVDKIYETMSSATVLPGADINNIKKGNLVIESR